MLSAPHPHLDSLRELVAEQVTPLSALHVELARRWHPSFDVAAARARLLAGRVAYQPARVIASVGSLVVPYTRAIAALQRAGFAAETEAEGARERRGQIAQLLAEWLSCEPTPRERVRAVARRAAVLVASSILRRASTELHRGPPLDGWAGSVCPCCGGPAEFRVREPAGSSMLICWRCDISWRTRSVGCLGCGATGAPAVARIESPALGYLLLVCHPCGRYLKEPAAPALIEPLVERALTAQLDAAAEARGLRL